jgi:hypothetical protein
MRKNSVWTAFGQNADIVAISLHLARASGSSGVKAVQVQVLFLAPSKTLGIMRFLGFFITKINITFTVTTLTK